MRRAGRALQPGIMSRAEPGAPLRILRRWKRGRSCWSRRRRTMRECRSWRAKRRRKLRRRGSEGNKAVKKEGSEAGGKKKQRGERPGKEQRDPARGTLHQKKGTLERAPSSAE